MKRRWFAVLLAGLMLVACAGQGTEQPVETPDAVPEETPVEVEVAEETPVSIMADTPVPVTPPPPPTPTPEPTPTPSPTPPPPLYGIVIGIDAGHQSRPNDETEPVAPDSEELKVKCSVGTRGIASNVYEYQVNLDVAKKLAALLEANGAAAVLTRTENNTDLSERARAEIMNTNQVDLAVLLHCNGTDDTSVRGAFVLVPTRERTETYSENVRAATEIIDAYCAATGIGMRKHNGIAYRSDMTCLNWCARPVICLEMGHLSNETEDLLLTNDSFQDKMAVGILEGILAYFNSGTTE